MRVRCSAFACAATVTSSVLSNCSAHAMAAHKRELLESHRLGGLHTFTRPRSRHGVLCSCESTRNEGGTGSSMCGNQPGSDSDCAKETEGCNSEGAPGSSKRGRLSPSAGWHWLCCSGSESSCQASDVSRRVTRRKKLRKSKTSLCRSLRSSSAWFGVLCRTHVLAAYLFDLLQRRQQVCTR